MEDGSAPRVVETHISTLFFVGDRVFKVRKPVRFGFVDFSDRGERERDCHREVDLNRRLAPDVYLGVLDLVDAGRPVDHLVVMRRLPDDRRLTTLLGADEGPGSGHPGGGRPDDAAVRALARTLAMFHAGAERGGGIDDDATPEALARQWAANFAETAPFVGPVLDFGTDRCIRLLAAEYLAGRRPLLRRRIALGAVCDGHGDLQADDIFLLDDGPRVLDCLEFDERLRHGDVAADLSFLVMDLQRLGADDTAVRLLADYEQLSGVALPTSLVRHYAGSRAYVRAKVACLRWAQGDEQAATAAVRLHQLSARNLAAGRVRMVLVGGRPGSGKSTVAAGTAGAIDAVVLRSDEIRKELAGLPGDRPAPSGWCEGLYRPAMTEATYRTMVDRAGVALGMGVSVVLDATWSEARWRELARRTAVTTHSALTELRCDVLPRLADRRLAARRRGGFDVSDATVATGRRLAATADPWPEATAVDTSTTRRGALAAALQAVGWPPSPPATSTAGHVPESAPEAPCERQVSGERPAGLHRRRRMVPNADGGRR